MTNNSHLSGAEYLASIFGTEKDKVNCSFYIKIGACRHGDHCSRNHNKPTFSQTVLLKNLYHNPKLDAKIAAAGIIADFQVQMAEKSGVSVSDQEEQDHFDEFFEEIFDEVSDSYGEIEEMNVCDNIGEHMIGNVYIKFRREEDAEKCVNGCNDRWFGCEPIYAELSPVTDFREACCRQYEMGECSKGGFCNFMHLKPISRELRKRLYGRAKSHGGGSYIGGGRIFEEGGRGGGGGWGGGGGGGGGGGWGGGGGGGWGGGRGGGRGGWGGGGGGWGGGRGGGGGWGGGGGRRW